MITKALQSCALVRPTQSAQTSYGELRAWLDEGGPQRWLDFKQELVTRDEEAWRQFIGGTKSWTLGVIVRLGFKLEIAEDIRQDAYLKVIKSVSQVTEPTVLFTWFYSVVINAARDYGRKLARSNKVGQPLSLEEAAHIRSKDDQSVSCILDSILLTLPKAQREVIVRRCTFGQEYGEIAKDMGITVETARHYFCDGIKRIRKAQEGAK